MIERAPFLIAYDYGMGGLWGVLRAGSADEIKAKYHEVIVVEERPQWMDDESFQSLLDDATDVEDPPTALLRAVIADRTR